MTQYNIPHQLFLYNQYTIQDFQATYPVLAGFCISSLPLDQWSFSIKRHVETECGIMGDGSVLTVPNIR